MSNFVLNLVLNSTMNSKLNSVLNSQKNSCMQRTCDIPNKSSLCGVNVFWKNKTGIKLMEANKCYVWQRLTAALKTDTKNVMSKSCKFLSPPARAVSGSLSRLSSLSSLSNRCKAAFA